MTIEKILVVGSGIMGRGIAYAAAVGGFQVSLYDVSEDALKIAEEHIQGYLTAGLERGKLSAAEASAAKGRIEYSTELEKLTGDVDLVIEAVPEDMKIKRSVFEKLDQLTPEKTILATNTSTMSPTELGSYTGRPGKVMAMHFFNPVPKMKLVEMIRGLETTDETTEQVKAVVDRMGKEAVLVNEFPGFVTSRMSSLVGNEAFHMLMEGVGTPEEIDKAIELGLNYPMGPFKLGDLVGLDTRLKNLEYLHQTLGERFRPSPLLVKYVKAGRLGRKTGKGVYDYTSE